VVVEGREAHSAYPALGSSAIFRAARLLSHIEAIGDQITSLQHELFDPPYTTLNVGLIKGGSAKNVIAGECRFTLEWRPVPGQDSGQLLKLIDAAIADEKRMDPEFGCRVNAIRSDSGFETPADSTLVRFLEKASGLQAGTVSFGTEAAQMMRLGGEAVVFGPGDIRVAHRTGEFVPMDELERCTDIIAHAITEYCY
jgi:acetylornithine deacetylase